MPINVTLTIELAEPLQEFVKSCLSAGSFLGFIFFWYRIDLCTVSQERCSLMTNEITPVPVEDCRKFETGARRSKECDDIRYDLISPIAMRRIAEAMAEGSIKYGDFNWEKGMPVHEILNHALAHIFNYLAGERDEDHLGHALWNLQAACHSDEMWPELNRPHLRTEGCKPPFIQAAEASTDVDENERWEPVEDFDLIVGSESMPSSMTIAMSDGVHIDAAIADKPDPTGMLADNPWSFTERHNAEHGHGDTAGFHLFYRPTNRSMFWVLSRADATACCRWLNKNSKLFNPGMMIDLENELNLKVNRHPEGQRIFVS